MATTAQDALARQIKRNVALGIVFCFVLTVLICLPAGIGLARAAAVAVLPAGFAGPFVGGLATVIAWVLAEERTVDTSAMESTDAPAEAPPVAIALPEQTPTAAAVLALTGPTPTGL